MWCIIIRLEALVTTVYGMFYICGGCVRLPGCGEKLAPYAVSRNVL